MNQNKRSQILGQKQPKKKPFIFQGKKTNQRRKFLTPSLSLKEMHRKGISLQRKAKISIEKLYNQSVFEPNPAQNSQNRIKQPSILTITTICSSNNVRETADRNSLEQLQYYGTGELKNPLAAQSKLEKNRTQDIRSCYYQSSGFKKTAEVSRFTYLKPLREYFPNKQYVLTKNYVIKVIKF